jgi:hypothetical protein
MCTTLEVSNSLISISDSKDTTERERDIHLSIRGESLERARDMSQVDCASFPARFDPQQFDADPVTGCDVDHNKVRSRKYVGRSTQMISK